MKINNYIRYAMGIYLGFCLHTLMIGSLSIFNFCILILLLIVVVKDISNGYKIQ